MKVTIASSITNSLEDYYGIPTIIKMTITDNLSNQYHVTVEMPIGWDLDKFTKTIQETFMMCEGFPVTVFLQSMEFDYKQMN